MHFALTSKLLVPFPLVGPSGNDPLPQDFQSRVRQPTIRQTRLKWLRVLGSNQLHGSQSPRYQPLYQPSILRLAILSPQAGTLFLLAGHSTAPPLSLNNIPDSHSGGESRRDIGTPICVYID